MGCEKQKEFQTNLDLPNICQIVAKDENKGTDVISGYSLDIVDISAISDWRNSLSCCEKMEINYVDYCWQCQEAK